MNTSILYPTCIKCMIPSPSSEVLCSPVPHNTSRQYIGVMHCLWTRTTRTKTSFTKKWMPNNSCSFDFDLNWPTVNRIDMK